jgi:hypothetical protein
MSSDKFISNLVNDLTPVKRVAYGKWEYGFLLFVSFVSILLAVLIFRPRSDIQEVIFSPVFVVETITLLAISLAANYFSFQLFIPGQESKKKFYLTLVLLFSWLIFLTARLLFTTSPSMGSGMSCVRDIVFVAIIPVGALFYMGRKGAPLRRSFSGLISLLTGASYGALSSQLICKNDDPLHILVWHSVVLLLLTGFGAILGKVFYRKI